jgi:putative ABC transport system permease protein
MIAESVRIALRALTANKLRTALTMLGIVIGVGAVIALLAIGRGASAAVESRFASLGANVVTILPGRSSSGGAKGAAGSGTSITYEDAKAIASGDGTTAIAAVAPERFTFGQVIAEGTNTNTRIIGTTPAYQTVFDLQTAAGEFFTDEQLQARESVAVLGASAAANLFGDSDPIGSSIRVNTGGATVSLRVIGVMERKGGTGLADKDDLILAPITTVMTRLRSQRTPGGAQSVSSINVKARGAALVPDAIAQASAVLADRGHGPDAYQILNVQDQIDAQKDASNTLAILLAAIAGISLVVGGIGVMNIMIVSVTERTREIGIRKAVGACRRDILLQFLMEALAVSISGGLIGIAAGIGASFLAEGRSLNGQQIETAIAPSSIVLAFGVSAAIGLFFGIYPASRAARLHPIEALRYE